ncbi:sensor histidine kinase [Georgenia sp. MJ206]|uniref:sensor histidine kinase n=1 Tax=Georgenia wangjunii TaxID=3117730 RepID=UPI002F262DC4
MAAPPATERSSALPSRLVDAAFATLLLLFFGVGSLGLSGVGDSTLVVLTTLVMPGALYWRRTRPVASAAVVHAGALTHLLAGDPGLPVDALVLVALYSVTVHGPVWASRVALASALLGSFLLSASFGYFDLGSVLFGTFALGAFTLFVWAIALVRRNRVERAESLRERARRLEVERDQQVQIATAAERARIAREMHDVVAHSLSVVIAQADGGRYAATADPDAAVRALTTIGETGRAALADMRRILGVLRAPDGGPDELATAPQPMTGDLDALVEQVRGTGLAVSMVRMGVERPLPPGAGLTVFRLCQEALTNVLKHAGPAASVTVMLQWHPQRLVLQVDDDGRGAAAGSDGLGQGVLGMRERAALFGGTLVAGPRSGGGFRVRAEIPLPAPTTADLPPPDPASRYTPPTEAPR